MQGMQQAQRVSSSSSMSSGQQSPPKGYPQQQYQVYICLTLTANNGSDITFLTLLLCCSPGSFTDNFAGCTSIVGDGMGHNVNIMQQ